MPPESTADKLRRITASRVHWRRAAYRRHDAIVAFLAAWDSEPEAGELDDLVHAALKELRASLVDGECVP